MFVPDRPHSGDLREEEKAYLKANGFLAVADFSAPEDLAELRSLINGLLDDADLSQKAIVRDLVSTRRDHMAIREVVSPSQLEPRLLQTRIYQRALGITRAMFGQDASLGFDHIIDKPAFNMKETAWHQDSAYSSPLSFSSRRLHWWIPLHDVNEANGCMAYQAGSHMGPRRKHVSLGPNIQSKKTDAPRADQITYCPIPAGGACMHLPKTLHYTGPNLTDKPRTAWIFQISVRGGLPRFV